LAIRGTAEVTARRVDAKQTLQRLSNRGAEEKMSTTAPFEPPVTEWGVFEGMRQIPPEPRSRSSLPRRKDDRAFEDDAKLLIAVTVLRQLRVRLDLNHGQCQVLTVNGASEIAAREDLRWDRTEFVERGSERLPGNGHDRVDDDRDVER
jgi:hypothetical protein